MSTTTATLRDEGQPNSDFDHLPLSPGKAQQEEKSAHVEIRTHRYPGAAQAQITAWYASPATEGNTRGRQNRGHWDPHSQKADPGENQWCQGIAGSAERVSKDHRAGTCGHGKRYQPQHRNAHINDRLLSGI